MGFATPPKSDRLVCLSLGEQRVFDVALKKSAKLIAKGVDVGCNIIVRTLDGEKHPDWLTLRRPGDELLANALRSAAAPVAKALAAGELLYRMEHLSDWRRWLQLRKPERAAWYRISELLEIIEHGPEWWVEVSW